MLIQVTQDDIDQGVRFSYCRCPIALAVKRVHPKDSVYVSLESIQIYSPAGFRIAHIALPNVARNFIVKFDNQRNPKPLEFTC